VFTAVLFNIAGKKIRIMILLYCIIMTYDVIPSLGMKIGLYLHAALQSLSYIRHYRSEFINNRTHSTGKTRGDAFTRSFNPLISFRLVVKAFENFKYPWDSQASTLLLFCLLNGFQVLFRGKELIKIITQGFAPRLDSYQWVCGIAQGSI